jgi:very-short-patch-repair endonuclease
MCSLKFRRQHPLGPYIVDFYCHQVRLVIEVDGGQHWDEEQRRYDARRTAYLQMKAIRVIRFSNDEVLKETEGVLEYIQQVIETRRKELDGLETPPPSLPRPVA